MIKLFTLASSINHPLATVDFMNNTDRIFDFFILDKGEGKFLDYTTPTAMAQTGYSKRNIHNSDYVKATIGIPIFSERFVESMAIELKDDLQFYKCFINCQGELFTFYLGKIIKKAEIIDLDKSDFRSLTDGSKQLVRARYSTKPLDQFHIARDFHYQTRIYVSDTFVKMIQFKGLSIEFIPA
ncbi:imm11 family protein [Olivibacter domesticus]|uniref:Uncharacterized protein n=1 Tax=Olivibacter domesticus TaxID=407022 RepID=A0A1H7IJ50_OLID1|nr:hypothetical protein [Olivibacter domesticus]SEK62364.1 hypothetical protein SAMN05661044_00719 [Olivibacter domesticus]